MKTSIHVIWVILSIYYVTKVSTNDNQYIDSLFTERERETLSELKDRVIPKLPKESMKTDFYLIRWLRAQSFNVSQAEKMLLQHLKWRDENKLDTVDQEDWHDMEADCPYHVDTHDLKGQPVGTVDIYEWDIRRVVLEGKSQRLMRYLYRLLENINDQIFKEQEQGNTNVTRFIVLGNADGFNMAQHACSSCLPVWYQFIRTFEAQYPDFLEQFIVIEAPATVGIILELIRPNLSEDTGDALQIFGHTKEKWMEYLDNVISRDQRRHAYGGTKSD